MDKQEYDSLKETEKIQYVLNRYDELPDENDIYATSTDIHLRELEIDFIIENIPRNNPKILDVGCGNGYTDIRIAKEIEAEITGMDVSPKMIRGANHLKEQFKDELMGTLDFQLGDCCDGLDWPHSCFDVVITERCIHNLPSRKLQYEVIYNIWKVLKNGGIYIMVEGTADGLKRLNDLRVTVGLDLIQDRKETNIMSLKLDEEEIEGFLSPYFKTIKKRYFGMYYLISRIVHPLLVAPDFPKFDARINEVARKIASLIPDYDRLGHVRGLVLKK